MIAYAIVLKNFIPLQKKVQILHEHEGKITCMFRYDQVALVLTTGSLIMCQVERIGNMYQFASVEMVRGMHSHDIELLQFMHDLIKICIKILPDHVAVQDVFEFLLYVYHDIDRLTQQGRQIVLLRMFLLCEMLPESPDVYHVAMQDPYSIKNEQCKNIYRYLNMGWEKFLQQTVVKTYL